MAEKMTSINYEILEWARTTSGTTLDEAYNKFGKDKIQMWESGQDYPTYAQLRSLSDYYKKPLAIFFFPNPPKIVDIKASCRTLPKQMHSMFNRELISIIDKARAMQINLYELYEGKNPSLFRFSDCVFDTNNIENAAVQLRDYLNAPLSEQKKVHKMSDYFEYWRDKFYNAGIFVFKDAFKNMDVSGFCLYDDEFPIIYINNTYSFTRQVFTLFHEIFHLMAKTSGLDFFDDKKLNKYVIGDDERIERYCNTFASVFLVPNDDFEVNYKNVNPHDENDVQRLANLYSVSREVILRKIRDRGDISSNEYTIRVAKYNDDYFRVKNKNSAGGGDYYNTQISYKGNHYIETAYSSYYEGRISITQLSGYMGMPISNLQTLAGRKGWIAI